MRAHLKLPSTEKLIVRSVLSDPDGTVHVRYDRTFQGLRVLGGDFIVTRAADRRQVIWNATGQAAVPSTTPAFAKAKAEALDAQHSVARGESTTSTLVVDARQGAPRLAYDVLTTGTRADQTPSRFHTIVDATTGAVHGTYDEVETGTGYSMYSGTVTLNTVLSGSTWLLKDSHGNYTTDLNGATSGTGTQFTDADNVWGNGTTSSRQTAGVDAEYGAERTYAYYSSVHSRAGIWNNGDQRPCG